jgi:LysM repeat protein
MIKQNCPYIGLKEDPTTALNFPSAGNHCYKTQPNSSINASHQQNYCLSANHITCPVYRQARIRPMPAALTYPANRKPQWKKIGAITGILFLLIVSSLAIASLNKIGLLSRLYQGNLIPQTGSTLKSPSFGWYIFDSVPVTSSTPLIPIKSTPAAQLESQSCPLPPGWTPYTVNPTDSLIRLSVVYEVGLEELAKASCLDKNSVVMPGQIIFVPLLPTKTPGTNPGFLFPRIFPTSTNIPKQHEPLPRPRINTPVPPPEATATFPPLPSPTVKASTPTQPPPATQIVTKVVPTKTLVPPTETANPTGTRLAPTPTKRPPRPRPRFPTATRAPTQNLPTVAPTQPPPLPTDAPTQSPPPTSAPTPVPPGPATDSPTQPPKATEVPTQSPAIHSNGNLLVIRYLDKKDEF